MEPSEAVNRIEQGGTIQRLKEKEKMPTIYKTKHRKLKTGQHVSH